MVPGTQEKINMDAISYTIVPAAFGRRWTQS
jgi:hypothetical protein